MDESLFEKLLLKGESETLDFKRDQYRFEGASDEDKSELLKDVLAFANAWRDENAYILIGVKWISGGRARRHGLRHHLEDASLQQFVNSKTQKPVTLRYESIEINGLSFGVISIPLQERPVYLKKPFGKLKEHAVYVRRGSSTDVAEPDEIARMGALRAPAISPAFSVTAHPEIRHRGSFEELQITLWLHNTGAGTGDDVLVIVQESPAGSLGMSHQFWIDGVSGSRGRAQRLKNPIHPQEHVPVFSIGLGEAGQVAANPQECRFALLVSARDRAMLNFVGELSPEDIRQRRAQPLEPRKP